jgi:hypothetical protein
MKRPLEMALNKPANIAKNRAIDLDSFWTEKNTSFFIKEIK